MRKGPLTKDDKERVESLLRELQLVPPVAGQVSFNLDANGKVANVELAKAVWR